MCPDPIDASLCGTRGPFSRDSSSQSKKREVRADEARLPPRHEDRLQGHSRPSRRRTDLDNAIVQMMKHRARRPNRRIAEPPKPRSITWRKVLAVYQEGCGIEDVVVSQSACRGHKSTLHDTKHPMRRNRSEQPENGLEVFSQERLFTIRSFTIRIERAYILTWDATRNDESCLRKFMNQRN